MPDRPNRPQRPPPERVAEGQVTDVPEEPTVAFTASPKLTEAVDAATCPHCGGVLTPHEGPNPHLQGAAHCDACGGCFRAGAMRRGHRGPDGYTGPVEAAP